MPLNAMIENTEAKNRVISILQEKTAISIPPNIQRQLYTIGSLKNNDNGVSFKLRNPLNDAALTDIIRIEINGREFPVSDICLKVNERLVLASEVSEQHYIPLPIGQEVEIHIRTSPLEKDAEHHISLSFNSEPFGFVNFDIDDHVSQEKVERVAVPIDKAANYESDIIRKRQEFAEEFSGVRLDHIKRYSIDPVATKGNIENFSGVAQIPMGFAGPIQINGEYAKGEFVVPMCTTEGTLVASYNRGIKVLNLSGGVITTIMEDKMQRSPVFVFESSRHARDFSRWVDEHLEDIRTQAESTSRVAKLLDIEKYLVSKLVYLRFNYYTGDAAGQNMVSMATFVACNWILSQYNGIEHFYMDGNTSTDKKDSKINTLHTRGKRVVAEFTIPRDVLIQHMRVDPETLLKHCQLANIGAFMAGSSSNGLHAANALAAMFIATGQDVANIAESASSIIYTDMTPEGDLYGSLTLPSLIVATYGGGTGLPTQRECLEIMGCYGKGKVKKFTEIVAAVAIAGELSLGAAISSLDWVSSHERHGKNR